MSRDGPLSRRPPEEIRYGTGKCALGRLLVASSDKGIVAILVRKGQARCLQDLRARLPKAALIRDEAGCAAQVRAVVRYVAAPVGRFGLPLDIRGTALQKRVWEEVRKIPFGATSTYAAIAAAIGAPKAIRAVASSCSRSGFAFAVPCHRVLHSGVTLDRLRKGAQYAWMAYELKLRTSPGGRASRSSSRTRASRARRAGSPR